MIMKKVCSPKQQLITLAMWALCFFFVDTFVVTGPSPASAGEETTVPSVSATQVEDYLIGAVDVLEILVWKEPDISRTVPVRPDGKISLPLVDDVQHHKALCSNSRSVLQMPWLLMWTNHPSMSCCKRTGVRRFIWSARSVPLASSR